MSGAWEWLYRHRDGFSYFMAAMVVLLAAMPRPALQHPYEKSPSTELMAMLEEPPPPAKMVPPSPPEPKPRPRPERPKPVPQPPKPVDPLPEPKVADPVPQPKPAEPPSPVPVPQPAAALPRPAPPPPVKSGVQKESPSVVASAHYERAVLAALERAKRYPTSREARLTRPEGTVKVWLVIDRSGELTDSGLLESSGSNLLDSAALRTVRLTSYPPFPDQAYEGQATHKFIASLKYEVNSDR